MEKENNDLENLYKSLSDIAVKIIVSDPSINDLIQKNNETNYRSNSKG